MKKQNIDGRRSQIGRWLLYVGGLLTLALGIVLNTKANLGVSPIISVSYVFSRLSGLRFGDASLAWYVVMVVVQVLIHCVKKDFPRVGSDLLQIPLVIVFTRFMNLFSDFIPEMQGIIAQLCLLLVAIVLTGIGAAMTVSARLVPNPGDGIVVTLAEVFRLNLGLMKNIFDCSCVAIAFAIGWATGNFLCGIGVGTVLAMLLVGRVMWLYNKVTGGKK